MPAIRKIRIVNFRFNNGAKLIPDEIFCTENADGKPVDTLLNMDNGGGKSMIVQLLLQPICPKGKIQERSISNYFQKGTDHAFVLIEWALDNSENSLLTGIAMSASTTADDENKSKTVRYYTFLHDYAINGDKINLVNLPLTERTGNRIRAMSFEELRKYLQNKKIEYYPSDSLRNYQKRLEEYGILHTEWEKIIAHVNAVEGGVTKFFENYKTADSLIDRFIIPSVMPDDTSSEETLEEMFINYADSYARQEEKLRLRSDIADFTEKLQGILPLIKDMWSAEDSRIQAIRLLSDHLFTIEQNIKLDTEKREQLEKAISDLKEKLHHIKAESASETFYVAWENFEKAELQLKECKRKKHEAEIQRDKSEHMIDLLNTAKEYAELVEQRNAEKALTSKIRELEHGTQDSRILSLKYSLFLMASELEKQTEKELNNQKNKMTEYSAAERTTQEKISNLERQYTDKNNIFNQSIGIKKNIVEQIDRGLKSLALHITVMLDGEYSGEDIENARAGYEKQIRISDEEIKNCQGEENALRQEIDTQDVKYSELRKTQVECEVYLRQQESALENYQREYSAVLSVLEHLSIPESRIFTDEPKKTLDRIIADLNTKLRQSERSAELFSEQLRCIESGQLHLSRTAVGFLQESGISYRTGEQYLNLQSEKIRKEILSVNTLVAYSVIVDSEREKKKLLSQPSESWLSAIVPVYTRSEIADIAEGKWNEPERFLSSFDREYFRDASAYRGHIQEKLDSAQTEIENIKSHISEWESEKNTLSKFTYTADYERKLQESISSYQDRLQEIQNELLIPGSRKSEIKKQIEELRKLREEQQEIRRIAEKNQSEFEQILDMILQYDNIRKKIAELEDICGQLSRQTETERKEKQRLSELMTKCDETIKQIIDRKAGYRDLLIELKDCQEAEKLSEDYSAMLAEYRLYQEKYSADCRELRENLKKVQSLISKKEREIQRFHIKQTEYENITYSESAYNRAEEQLARAKRETEQADGHLLTAAKFHANAVSALEQSEKKLAELHTELLPRSEVGSDFERRIKECESEINFQEKNLYKCKERLNNLNIDRKYTAGFAEKFKRDISGYTPKITDTLPDTDSLREKIENRVEQLKQAEDRTKIYHRRELEPFRSKNSMFSGTLDGILSVIDNNSITGDKYFTLYERTESDINLYQKRIAHLNIMLKDVENSRKQLVTNCLHRVERLYDNLVILSKKSTIQFGNTKKQMIRIELPAVEPLSEQPAKRIDNYIAGQVGEYLSECRAKTVSHRCHLEIRRLLNCYIGRDDIPVNVFKIDKNFRNSCYLPWQNAPSNNSGGEQFVVLFSLIISVMNYTRSLTNSLNQTSGVLILDNPFGPISSPHLLEPMFSIARHFNIQLICLTHLGTATVTRFFDMVYQLRFRNLPLSNVEILESEVKQHMEHAYYLSEQLSLF